MKIAIAFVLLGLISNVLSLSCLPCDQVTCRPSYYCPAGWVKDVCHCCYVCAKDLGEKCGGLWGLDGECGYGLECVDLPLCAKPVGLGSPGKKSGICLPKKDVKIMRQYCKYDDLYCKKPKPKELPPPSEEEPIFTLS